jgi:hypothetical protein
MLPAVGTKIMTLEGVDLGGGAVVQRVGPGKLTLLLTDQNRTVTYKVPDDIAWAPDDQADATGLDDTVVDESAQDFGPATKRITRLPKQWGPEDPNHFSPMSDVTWRPEQWDQRYLRRWYSKEIEMPKQAIDYLRGTRRTAIRDAAAADSHGTVDLSQWDLEGTDQKPAELEALALQFRQELDTLTVEWHPEFGRGNNVSPAEFMLVWGPDQELSVAQQDELWRFMVAVKMWDVREYQAWKRLRSSDQWLRSELPRTAKTHHAAMEIDVEDWFDDIDPWADWLARFDGFARAEEVAHKVAAQEGVVLARDVVQYGRKVVQDARDRVLDGSLVLGPDELTRLNQYLAEMKLDPIEGPDETVMQDIQDFKRTWGR